MDRGRRFGSLGLVRPKHLVPNVVTLANIALGFLSIIAAADGRYEHAVYFLFAAALCDMMDGRLARMLDASSKFGMELDSLSDVVSFGIAPAVLVYLSVLRDFGTIGTMIAVAYLLCGALRLARFNIDENPLAKVTFQGAPIPVAAGYVMSFILVRRELPSWLVAGGVLSMALFMVTTLKVPKFRKNAGPPIFMMVIGMIAFTVFMLRPSALTWHIWNGWNVVCVIANYMFLHKHGYLGRQASEALKRAA